MFLFSRGQNYVEFEVLNCNSVNEIESLVRMGDTDVKQEILENGIVYRANVQPGIFEKGFLIFCFYCTNIFFRFLYMRRFIMNFQ